MKVIIQAKQHEPVMQFFLNLCRDLFPEGIAFQFTTDEPSIVRTDSQGKVIEVISDPTAVVCLELPREIIRLATLTSEKTTRSSLSQNSHKLSVFIAHCSEGKRCEVEAARRITAAGSSLGRTFSVEFYEVVKYLSPHVK